MKNFKKIISSILVISVALAFLVSFTACNNSSERVKSDISFAIENNTKVMDVPIAIFLNKKDSGITLRKDGTMTLRFALNSAVPALINSTFNISTMLGEMDFNEYMSDYVSQVFPGFTLQDVPASLGLIEHSLGLTITGLDLASDNTQTLFEGLETGVFAENIAFPPNIGLEYNGPYTLKQLKDADGKDYTVIYMGKHEKNGESFVVMGLDENSEGKKVINCRVNFINFIMTATEI